MDVISSIGHPKLDLVGLLVSERYVYDIQDIAIVL